MYPTYQNKIRNLKEEIKNDKKNLLDMEESFNTIIENESGSVVLLSVLSDKIEMIKSKIKIKKNMIKEILLKISN